MRDLGIDKLSIEDRLALVGDIWDSIADEVVRAPLSEHWRLEVERRWARHLENPDQAIPWEQVYADAMARLGRQASST